MIFIFHFIVWTSLFFSLPTYAVKDYLFKKCDQNGFCNRNRHYRDQIVSMGFNYEPRYSIDRSSLQIDEKNGLFSGIMQKQLNDGSFKDLIFDISIINDYNLRFKLDEKERIFEDNEIRINNKRYNEASEWAFVNGNSNLKLQKFSYKTLDSDIFLTYGEDSEYEAMIKMYPFKIVISYNDIEQIIINDNYLLNIEHYRTKEAEDNNIDVLPEESKYNAFSDDFKDSKADRLLLGPESIACDFTFVNYTHVYGIPEHADSFSLKDTSDGEPYRLYNVDIFEYETQSKLPMYGSIPLMIAVKPDVSSAIFWVNSADTYIDIEKIKGNSNSSLMLTDDLVDKVKTHWISENGIMDVIFMIKSKPSEISKSYGNITGYTKLPNLFSLGYHQCRWNYNDEADVLNVHSNFDKYEIPYDTIWLDIEYADEKKYFTWNKESFPNPDKMMSILDETKRQLVVIVDPHIKEGYYVSDYIINNEIGIKDNIIDSTYHGHCWPGKSVWIDTLNPKSQKLWDLQFKNGSELLGYSTNGHLWNDMNEPSVFNGPETSAPKDLMHYGNYEHRSIHNLYGLTFHETTYNSLIKRNSNKRPFILTRSFFAGSQRTAAMWTGDNMARWEYLKESIPMVLTMNIVGFPFAGADVGGFFGNPSKELLVRWYQTGIWYPFFRAHAHIDSRRREPWIAGGEYTDIIRETIKLRYRLLPTLYTEFWKNSLTGNPILKPLLWENPEDLNGYEIDNEFYMNGLLVHPIVEEDNEETEIYLPCDNKEYYNFYNFDEKYESCQTIKVKNELSYLPIFMKSGNILVTKDIYRRSSQLMKYDPYTLTIVIDNDGKAKGELYIDDGETFGYELGEWIQIDFEADDTKREIKSYVKYGGENGDGNRNGKGENGLVKQLRKFDVKINKIVVIGTKIGNIAKVVQNNNEWESEILVSKDEVDTNYFTIRKPDLSITDEWTIAY